MKSFIHHDIPRLRQINETCGGSSRRLYETPTGDKYPSVTTVVGFSTADKIVEWRNKVGAEEANRISSRASKRGTSIHSLCEGYLKNESQDISIFDQDVFNSLKPHLDRIDNIHCIETPLYSHKLQIAGTVDLIAEYDGYLYVIDFKTSKKPKKEEWITNYFTQVAAYSFCFWELTGILVDKSKIIIGVDDSDAQVFTSNNGDYLSEFINIRKQFKDIKGY